MMIPMPALQNLKAIVTAERARRERQTSLDGAWVRDLQTEYEGQCDDLRSGWLLRLMLDAGAWIAPGCSCDGQRHGDGIWRSVWFGAVHPRRQRTHHDRGRHVTCRKTRVLHTDMGFPVGHRDRIAPSGTRRCCMAARLGTIQPDRHGCDGSERGRDWEKLPDRGRGALITEGKVIPDGSLVMGIGKIVRDLDAAAIAGLTSAAVNYQRNAARFRAGLKEV